MNIIIYHMLFLSCVCFRILCSLGLQVVVLHAEGLIERSIVRMSQDTKPAVKPSPFVSIYIHWLLTDAGFPWSWLEYIMVKVFFSICQKLKATVEDSGQTYSVWAKFLCLRINQRLLFSFVGIGNPDIFFNFFVWRKVFVLPFFSNSASSLAWAIALHSI